MIIPFTQPSDGSQNILEAGKGLAAVVPAYDLLHGQSLEIYAWASQGPSRACLGRDPKTSPSSSSPFSSRLPFSSAV